ncbi:MAG TPA: phage major capsid protein [Terriglobales bacterium]|nr:phage major capsid protein [Terriglobales bacterium]
MSDVLIPTSPDEFEATLNDQKKMQELYKAPGALAKFVTGYANSMKERDETLSEQIRDQVQLTLKDWLAENEKTGARPMFEVNGPSTAPAMSAKNALYQENAPGTALDGKFKNRADFFRGVYADYVKYNGAGLGEYRDRMAEVAQVKNSFGSTIPADGGFLIPEVLRSQLLMLSLESAVVRPRATVIPMDSLRVPIPMVDSTTNATSVYGGIIAYWGEEGALLVESQGAFGRVVLDAKKLTAFAGVPNELPQDASAFSAFLDAAFPSAMAWYEDIAFMKGSGTGEPLGWIGCPATVTASAVSGQGANTIVVENLAAMFARMLPTSLSRAVWVASIDTFPQLATMALSVGTGGAPVMLTNSGISDAMPMSIWGRPVIFTEKANTLGTAGDISFVDLSYYLIGDRMQMQASASEHYLFGNDKVAYRFIQRLDGRPWLNSAITPQNAGNTLSPFVNLSSTRT